MAIRKKEKGTGCLGYIVDAIIGLLIILGVFSFLGNSDIVDVNSLINGIKNADISQITSSISNTKDNITSAIADKVPSPATTTPTSTETDTSFNASNSITDIANVEIEYQPLSFKGELQLELGDYDSLGRATYAHIQLKNSDEPKSGTREPKITFNPVGWHNYKFSFINDKGVNETAWLMNRGHLIGYQFSGLNSEGKNLIPITRYLNAGSISDKIMDVKNEKAMLFYEQQLDLWLRLNTDKYLDYMVIPNYTDNELIPRTVTLIWTGFDSMGNQIEVDLNSVGMTTTFNKVSQVTLENVSANAEIDYLTGTATQK